MVEVAREEISCQLNTLNSVNQYKSLCLLRFDRSSLGFAATCDSIYPDFGFLKLCKFHFIAAENRCVNLSASVDGLRRVFDVQKFVIQNEFRHEFRDFPVVQSFADDNRFVQRVVVSEKPESLCL